MVPIHAHHELALASHVRACQCDGHIILLDLRRSRYLGIEASASRVLAQRIQHWPTSSQNEDHSHDHDLGSSATADLLHKLVSRGLVVKALAPSTGDDVPPRPAECDGLEEATSTIELDQALEEASGRNRTSRAATSIRRSLQFARSVACAACWIRCRSLQSIASDVARRRARLQGPQVGDIESMKPRVAAYERLRPFVFTARDECLLDSLALINFLAHDGLAPRWVLGVRTGPFGAHAWVQAGHTVLSDLHEYVRQFRPILVV